jgi:hypothetical protein
MRTGTPASSEANLNQILLSTFGTVENALRYKFFQKSHFFLSNLCNVDMCYPKGVMGLCKRQHKGSVAFTSTVLVKKPYIIQLCFHLKL